MSRRSLRRLFRRLALIGGGVFAFVGGIFFLGLFMNRSDPGSGSFFGHTTFSGIIAWLVITFALFVIGWLLIKALGLFFLAFVPRPSSDDYSESSEGADPKPVANPPEKVLRDQVTNQRPGVREPHPVPATQSAPPRNPSPYNRNKKRLMRKGRALQGS